MEICDAVVAAAVLIISCIYYLNLPYSYAEITRTTYVHIILYSKYQMLLNTFIQPSAHTDTKYYQYYPGLTHYLIIIEVLLLLHHQKIISGQIKTSLLLESNRNKGRRRRPRPRVLGVVPTTPSLFDGREVHECQLVLSLCQRRKAGLPLMASVLIT